MVILHPQVVIKTAESRAVLPAQVPLNDAVHQAAWLGRLVHDLHAGNELDAMYALEDMLVGPHRAALMPHWEDCQKAARAAGARAGGISGSGPSSFWVCRSAEEASDVAGALAQVMNAHALDHHLHLTQLSTQGAHVVS
jgi:homoserine kinase